MRCGADDQEGQIVFAGDAGYQGLGSIPAGHSWQVRAGGHRLEGQGRHIHRARAFQQRHVGAERLGFLLQLELRDLSPPTSDS